MSEEKIRVVHTIPMGAGGISSLTMAVNEAIDRTRFEFDYLVFRDQKEFCDERAARLGSPKLIADVSSIRNPILKNIAKIRKTRRILKEGGYRIMHVDASTPYDVVLALAAKMAGVKTVVFHSHNEDYEHKATLRNALMPFFRFLIPFCVTDYIAVSEAAAKFMFPKKVVRNRQYRLIPNGIDADRYGYDPSVREAYRKRFGWGDRFVVGHVGRFVYQKNHDFLVDVFAELKKKRDDALLVLIGDGELQDKVRNKVERLGLTDSVVFFGVTHEVPQLMQAMDVFLFPSRYEGLGIAAVEAQAAGLPTVVTDGLPKELEMTDCLRKVSLSSSAGCWAGAVLEAADTVIRCDRADEVKRAGYDIRTVTRELEGFYASRA